MAERRKVTVDGNEATACPLASNRCTPVLRIGGVISGSLI